MTHFGWAFGPVKEMVAGARLLGWTRFRELMVCRAGHGRASDHAQARVATSAGRRAWVALGDHRLIVQTGRRLSRQQITHVAWAWRSRGVHEDKESLREHYRV